MSVDDHMRKNLMWRSHCMILPAMRGLTDQTCGDCRFLILIQGREETKYGCVQIIPMYGNLEKRVPHKIHAIEIIKQIGKEGLTKIVSKGDPLNQVCGKFRERL